MQFNRFLLIGSSWGLILLTQCSKTGAPAPIAASSDSAATPAAAVASANAPATSVPLVKEGLSPTFRAVTSHLDVGGCSFSYMETSPGSAWASILDSVLSAMPASERKDIPPDFSVAKIFSTLGLDSLVAMGSSSRERADGSFHSRAIAYVPSGRKGVFTLPGGPASKFLLLDVAPKDTDLGIELSLNLKDFMHDSWPKIVSLVPASERGKLEEEISQPIPGLGLTTKQVLEKLDVRLGLFVHVDPSQNVRLSPTAPALPGMDGVLVIDHLGWLIEALKPQFMPMLKDPSAPVEVTEADGMLTLRAKAPLSAAPLDFQPVVRYDSKADRILLATRPAIFDAAVQGTDKFTQREDYAEIWRDLPSEGNDCIFASKKYLKWVGDTIAAYPATQGSGASQPDAVIVGKLVEWARPLLGRSQVFMVANQPDGIMTFSNMSIAFNPSTMSTLWVVSVLASAAVPAANKVQEKGNQANEINKARQVVLALKTYASSHGGKYPKALADLALEGTIPDGKILLVNDPVTHTPEPWLYNAAFSDSTPGAPEVILVTRTAYAGGKRVAAFSDGSARLITEAEFELIKGTDWTTH